MSNEARINMGFATLSSIAPLINKTIIHFPLRFFSIEISIFLIYFFWPHHQASVIFVLNKTVIFHSVIKGMLNCIYSFFFRETATVLCSAAYIMSALGRYVFVQIVCHFILFLQTLDKCLLALDNTSQLHKIIRF